MADEEQAAEESSGGGKKKLILLIVGALILISVSVGGTVAVLTIFKEDPPAVEEADDAAMEEKSMEETKMPAVYFPLNPSLLMTYNVRGRQRYAQIDITLMTRSDTVVTEIELHSSRVRNDLILAFSGMEYEEIQTPEGKELMRQTALTVVQTIMNEEIGEPGVEQILFTNFVMQ
ncbi:flagellar basal body-associated FliL family protein [Sessilibacter sp. MAH2]